MRLRALPQPIIQYFKSTMNDEKKTSIELTDWDRECMAWHEAGHAVCAHVLPEGSPVLRVSIVPGDDAFGSMQRAIRPHHNETERSFRSSIGVFLAGGLSERLFLRRRTTSLADDLRVASQIARDMVLRFGMGRRTGWLCLPDGMPRSDAFLGNAEADMREILNKSAKEAAEALGTHAALVKSLALRLLSEGTVSLPFSKEKSASKKRRRPS